MELLLFAVCTNELLQLTDIKSSFTHTRIGATACAAKYILFCEFSTDQ